jgi:glycosyltransferase involved in cell wall biosynthesis
MTESPHDRPIQAPIKINWEGSLFVHHSLGMVNREIHLELVKDSRFSFRHVPYEDDQFAPGAVAKLAPLTTLTAGPHGDAAVHVRHRWPPDFTPPSSGAYVLFQPWEYGCLPIEWVETIPRVVREVWVYTNYLRECYIASGLEESIIKVIPLGIDPGEFRPEAAAAGWLREMIGERFCFFYNGGITLRKGVDILINAYLNEFKPGEQVCLVIKGSNAYKKELAGTVESLARRTDAASMIYLTQDIPPQELPSLYTACDCYVQPYRAEGYGLPIAEAMACGKPVIVTGAGACRDFAGEDDAYLIKCTMEKLNTWSVSGIKTVGNPFWLLPDIDDLRQIMRYVYEHRDEARERGSKASRRIREHHTWRHSAEAVAARIVEIVGKG